MADAEWAALSDAAYRDGVKYKILIGHSRAILAALFEERNQFRVSLWVLNCDSDQFTVFPQSIGLFEFEPSRSQLAQVSPKQIEASIHRHSFWALFLTGISASSSQKAPVYDNNGKQVGTVDLPDTSAQERATDNANAIRENANKRTASVESAAFKTNTLAQFQSTSGDLYFKRDKNWKIVDLSIGISDYVYAIEFRRDGKDMIQSH